MKVINAVIKPFKLDEVTNALSKVGVEGLTVTEVRGFGRQKGHKQSYRGTEYAIDFVPKLLLEIVVADHLVEDVMGAVLRAARTGEIGDGKVFVSSLDEVVRIRTGEKGHSAV